MSWEIKIPFQDRSQTIPEAIKAHVDQALEGEDRDIAFQLFLTTRSKTLGELIDHIESLDADGRRQLLNRKRAELGLESVEDVDAHRRFEEANRNLRPGRDAQGRTFQVCAEPSCSAWPQGEQGEPLAVADRRWFCDRHKSEAGPDDHLPPEARYELDFATMSLKAVGAERERLLEEDRKREQKAREREQLRREEAEQRHRVEEARRATQGLPVGWGPRSS